ncbi:MAG: histidinol dehydrogenase [Methanocorpusculum sp.]|uniref:histidinol dehydrogenase n=1 Tax=unclassified Methanocorpusculum TaxID=225464 RepID=UPI001FD86614|nr:MULTISPECIES: histidinol dehydrogenase [unclassified Methanocorpusculum]MDD2802751.1 histidinol dehydrogenase [Methanocorpusculum sp.]MEA5086375.1 histidinol dehydrogenase [Methanocorpusculum sp.]
MLWQPLNVESWVSMRRGSLADVKESVEAIIGDVRKNGDAALFALTEKFDKQKLSSLQISQEAIDAAYDEVDPALVQALIEAEARISRFHELQMDKSLWLEETEPGITLGVKTTPLDRVGAYIPGGRAAYPSTVLMTTVAARVAGVPEIVLCTPPPVHPLTLVALDIAGVTEAYSIGGAQAIAALALGTETIRPVQKIVGPGNVFVTQAKMLLREYAEIDFPAGPSEIGVLADESANPAFIAADILAQAEHDPNAACVLVTSSERIAHDVGTEIEKQIASAPRREIMEKALAHSGYVIAGDLDEAVDLMNEIAPEHLSIQTFDPLATLGKIRHAGSIFIGPYTPVACGDYASGTNHVLPTAGYAKSYSALDVHHFMKRSQVQMVTRDGLDSIGDIIELLAGAEGLAAHAASVMIRRS